MKLKAIVLLSGGIDSATVLHMFLKRGYDLTALTFDYEEERSMELEAAKAIAQNAKVEHLVYQIEFYKKLSGSPSSSHAKIVDDTHGMSNAYVPARNVVFLGMATALAETIDAKLILTGHNRGDAKRFPDADAKFLRAFNRVIEVGLKNKESRPKVKMPLRRYDKFQVLKKAIRFGVPLELTWSCYNNGPEPCGMCYGCISRNQAFYSLGVSDPWRK
ncbi:MAG: 7-cyano-7-deazaguanine synthase QueC [Conexivisphaerales archaeon]